MKEYRLEDIKEVLDNCNYPFYISLKVGDRYVSKSNDVDLDHALRMIAEIMAGFGISVSDLKKALEEARKW